MNATNLNKFPANETQPSAETLVNEAQLLKLSLERMLELSRLYLPASGMES